MYFVVVVFIYSLNVIVYSLNSFLDPSPRGIYLFRKLSLQRQPPKSVCSGAGRAGSLATQQAVLELWKSSVLFPFMLHVGH